MTDWLKLSPDQRRASLNEVEYESDIPAKIIEKDWWVTLALRVLFQGSYAKYMVFKGGTSLSKCWNLIYRFSEDIDIALAPEAFGMEYRKNPSKTYVEKLKRSGCLFTSNELKDELQRGFMALGMADGMITIIADPIPENRPDTDPQVLHINYPTLFDPDPYIADEVKLEVSVRSLQNPFSKVGVHSLLSIYEPIKTFVEEPILIDAVVPHKTFLEKVFLLHEEFGKPDPTKIRSERMSRHLYDLSRMVGTEWETQALEDHALYDELRAHRESYYHIPWVKYETLGHKTIQFIPPPEVLELYRVDYQAMQEQMIHGTVQEFDQMIAGLRSLQQRFRASRS